MSAKGSMDEFDASGPTAEGREPQAGREPVAAPPAATADEAAAAPPDPLDPELPEAHQATDVPTGEAAREPREADGPADPAESQPAATAPPLEAAGPDEEDAPPVSSVDASAEEAPPAATVSPEPQPSEPQPPEPPPPQPPLPEPITVGEDRPGDPMPEAALDREAPEPLAPPQVLDPAACRDREEPTEPPEPLLPQVEDPDLLDERLLPAEPPAEPALEDRPAPAVDPVQAQLIDPPLAAEPVSTLEVAPDKPVSADISVSDHPDDAPPPQRPPIARAFAALPSSAAVLPWLAPAPQTTSPDEPLAGQLAEPILPEAAETEPEPDRSEATALQEVITPAATDAAATDEAVSEPQGAPQEPPQDHLPSPLDVDAAAKLATTPVPPREVPGAELAWLRPQAPALGPARPRLQTPLAPDRAGRPPDVAYPDREDAAPRRGVRHWVRRVAVYGLAAFAIWLVAVMAQIALFRFVDPPYSNLMLFHRLSGEIVVQQWLPVERMPTQLIRAIVVSEDGRFCSHGGIDLKELELAIERSKDGTPRGASTITMQVAKNLFLWPSKSYIRKALEVPLTLAIEAMWSKRRIFEVYANIAEWGPGVFGVEAASGYHFGKSAERVSEREAALLAVALPNPVARDAGDPGPGTERLASTIQARMRAMSRSATCVERAPRG